MTVEICMNAAGFFVRPLFNFPRKRMKDELMDNSPPGSIAVPHKSGWMQSHCLVSWFEHFLKHTNPSADRPVLLILDGHKTHTNNLPFIELGRSKFVTVLCLPPHCSHRMLPLDVSFMKPLMTFYTCTGNRELATKSPWSSCDDISDRRIFLKSRFSLA